MLRGERLEAAVQQVPRDHADAAAAVLDELPGEELLVDADPALHHLLVQDLDQDVPGDVGRVGRAGRAGRAERPLCDPPVLGAREDGAPVLELEHVARRLGAEDLDRVLVGQVVGALDRVEGVELGVVLRRVSERRVDPALGRTRMAARRVDLREQRDIGAGIERLDRCAHTGTTGADDENVVRRFHGYDASGTGSRPASLPWAGCGGLELPAPPRITGTRVAVPGDAGHLELGRADHEVDVDRALVEAGAILLVRPRTR